MGTIALRSVEGDPFTGYLALPPSGRGPGLVLMQEIFGVNQVMRDQADWFAARGFVVLCPDLFFRQEPNVQLSDQSDAEWQRALSLYRGLDEARAVEDCYQAVRALRSHDAVSGPVGGVGYCLGGKLAYLLAARHDVDACVGYYGVGIDANLDEAARLARPLLLHVAGRDSFCPPKAHAAIQQRLDGNQHVTRFDYPEQEHAFARRGGKHFDAASAELADLRTVDFLLRHLQRRAAPSLQERWDEHVKYEFVTRNTEDTLATMVADAYVNHIPTMTGGRGHDELRQFYSRHFIPQMPPDTSMVPVSRTVGVDRVVDEMIFRFTHTTPMDWMLPGVAPTGRRVEVPLVVIVHFRDGMLAHEHIYWDQASVLAQLGLLDASQLPVVGAEGAHKVLDPALVPNALIRRAVEGR